jgi:uncharacterized lipoprotein YajG
MKTVIIALAAVLLAGCASGPSSSGSQPPNYVVSQATQAPAIRNDGFGGGAMPMRGQPR